jgi:general secretion pathway protein D
MIRFLITVISFFLTACVQPPRLPPITLPEPLRPPVQSEEISAGAVEQPHSAVYTTQPPNTAFKPTPVQPPRKLATAPLSVEEFIPDFGTNSPISVNVEGLPLPAFINEVFGNLLGLSFEMDSRVQRKRDLITLRIGEPQQPLQLFRLAIQVLGNYDVGIEKQGNLIRFIRDKDSDSEMPSLIGEGFTLPEVPNAQRPIIQFIPLKVVRNSQIRFWMQQIFKDQKLTIQEDAYKNALILIGTPPLILQAMEAISVLDQPLMKGQYSVRIEPVFLSAPVLANKLIDILNAHGYGASSSPSSGSIIILPIQETNSIIVFTSDMEVLSYVQQWADQLDQLNPKTQRVDKPGLFFYPVKNTSAELIAQVLNKLPPQLNLIATEEKHKTTANKIVVDPHRNGLLFTGTGEEWVRLLPILQQMDKPPKQVLIEVTIAEITLSNQDERGIEWIINRAGLGGLDGVIGTVGSLGLGSSGLSYTLSNAGEVRAILNAFATSSRATILSTPRLMVRSGSQASIDIGTEIPTLTSQSTTNQVQAGGNTALLQQIQYRRTGILLSIKPVVYAGRRVDLDVNQQVSEARENTTSNISSPAIFNRSIQTQLTLKDGHSVLLGGQISNNRTEGWSGIPLLSEIPLIGQLFRVNRASADRTELVILIVPYVLDDAEEAKAISDSIKRQFKLLSNPLEGEEEKKEDGEKVEKTPEQNSKPPAVEENQSADEAS